MKASKSEGQLLAERARALHALSCLMQLVVTARAQTDIVTWQWVGGLEAENFLDALERGLPHPVLSAWEEAKAGNSRPGPSLRERQFRRLAVLLSVALQGARVPKREARKRTVKALKHLMPIVSHRAVERWELELNPPLSAEDEKIIKAALQPCGPDPAALIKRFIGFVRFPRLGIDSRLLPSVTGDGNMLENEDEACRRR